MTNYLEEIKKKNILVIGLGRSGIGAVKALVKIGASNVSVQDSKTIDNVDKDLVDFLDDSNVTYYFGCIPEDLGQFDMLVVSPGVSPEVGFIKEAFEKGAEIIGELELAYRIGKGKYIGITGTNGKTTTTTLVGEIFKASGRTTHVVGNIGVAVVSASVDADEDTWLVTETSSFQLETTKYFRPMVSAILNLTPDHLNRHHTMENYGKAKANIFANQTEEDYAVMNFDNEEGYKLLSLGCKAKVVPFSRKKELEFGVFVANGKIVVADGLTPEHVEFCNVDDVKIIGTHNLENVLAAVAICYFAGIEKDVIGKTVANFGGVEHRIEFSGIVNGVKYYNDSKGTNVDAAVTALNALENNIILIAGGDGKAQNFDEFISEFGGKVKHMILLGKDAKLISESADKVGFKDYTFASDMEECVKLASEIATEGDKVLLSPACASWDMYDNYEKRGEHFKNCVSRL